MKRLHLVVLIAVLTCGCTGFAVAQSAPAAAPAEQPPATTPAPPAPLSQPPAESMRVVLVITPETRAVVWSKDSILTRPMPMIGPLNQLGSRVADHAYAMLRQMGLDAQIATTADPVDGARFYVTPTIARHEQNLAGFTAFSKMHSIVALEWNVRDAKGQVVLQDTVVFQTERRVGNMFTGEHNAEVLDKQMMDGLVEKSRALLEPVLNPSAAAPTAAPTAPGA